MSHYLPSWKGFAAVLVSFFASMLIPALLSAKDGHTGKFMTPVSAELWIITAITIIAALAFAMFAFRRGTRPDRVAAVLAGILSYVAQLHLGALSGLTMRCSEPGGGVAVEIVAS